VAHEEGNFHSFSAVLGNDLAIQAYAKRRSRSQTVQLLQLCITVTCLRTKTTKSLAKNNLSYPAPQQTFSLWSRTQKKYAATGGWGFAHFQDGKPSGDEAFMKTCFPCHNEIKARDLVFTRYAK
jgi:hypothetical protein